jgi:UvrD-like helicase C-terminal domain/AAA domain
MTVTAFEGPAGTGKTHSLMGHLSARMRERPLALHERVLALTFMHGARRRLDSRLREIDGLGGRYHAATVDSFAWRLIQRWRRLAGSLRYAIPPEEQYDETCALAGALLTKLAVRSWVGVSFPLILVDEAQDLSAERSTMIEQAAASTHVAVAYDEFQCLNPDLRPVPVLAWLPGFCQPVRLMECRRTDDAELLEAARAVREGQAVNRDGRHFKVMLTPGQANFAATCLANFIRWCGGGRVAVLTPSRRGGFADGIVKLVCTRSLGKQQSGPYQIVWESGDEAERRDLWQRLALPERCSIGDALTALEAHEGKHAAKAAKNWITRQKKVLGVAEITAGEIKRQIDRSFATRRRYAAPERAEFLAMTIQQAKNREFDHVVVIWPYTIPNDNEQKRRLLYNAITRAQRSCLVLVQARELLDTSPFIP